MDTPRSVLLAGATGLVGSACLPILVREPAFRRVVVPTRRPLPVELRRAGDGSGLEEHVVDFRRLRENAEMMGVDVVICALGTTIKKAGSKEAFREVDYDYPITIAELAKERGARHYLLVSAIGASSKSVFFYNRVKGDVENRIRSMEFPSLTILRPSLLLGDRDEFRLGEEIAKRLSVLVPERYKPVPVQQIARVLVDAAKRGRPGVEIVESREIRGRAIHNQ